MSGSQAGETSRGNEPGKRAGDQAGCLNMAHGTEGLVSAGPTGPAWKVLLLYSGGFSMEEEIIATFIGRCNHLEVIKKAHQ